MGTHSPTGEQAAAEHGSGVFWRYWSGSTVSRLGSAVTTVALPLTALTVVHASTFAVAVIAAAGQLPWLVLGLPAGVLVARLPLRETQVAMDLIRGCAIASIPAVAWAGDLTVAQLAAVSAVVGVATVIFDVGNSTLMPAIVPADQLTKRNSLNSASDAATQLAGPGLGGVLVQLIGAASCMLTDGVSYLVSAVLLRSLPRPPSLEAATARAGMRREIAEGCGYVARHPVIRPCVVWATVVNFVCGALLTLTPLYLVRSLHARPVAVGLVYAAEGAGALLGASLTPRLETRLGSARTMLLAASIMPLTVVLMPAAFPGWGISLYALGNFAFAGAVVIGSILARTHRHQVVPRELLPRVMATVRFISWGVLPIGAFLAGVLASALGIRDALWVAAGVILLAPAAMWASTEIRRRRNLSDPDARRARPTLLPDATRS
jgi:predicted MFS family arabinose efflux permease